MRYHSINIKRINAVIKDLWNKTYKGHDITNIEIKADAAASSRSVGSFQYSLVMKKGNAVIDMRQRCSAGQKVRTRVHGHMHLHSQAVCRVRALCGGVLLVFQEYLHAMHLQVLASLVIRLALAEVYGMKCGVMALDEPTTNLDGRHKESLARALADIIETRSRDRSNFQLILITHDRAFVDLLHQYQVCVCVCVCVCVRVVCVLCARAIVHAPHACLFVG